MKKGDLVKRCGNFSADRRPELGIVVGFEEGPLQAPYVRWFTNPHEEYVSLEERCMVEVLSEER